MRIFISHCSSDKELFNKYKELFDFDKKKGFFYSSSPETGIESGNELMRTINKEVSNCDTFVALITENYVRSIYCLYELNIATYLVSKKRKIIPIVVNDSVFERVKPTLEHLNLIYLNATNKDEFIYRFMNLFSISSSEKEMVEQFRQEFATQTTSKRNYIGMDKDFFNNVTSYCEEHHIKSLSNSTKDNDTLIEKCRKAKEITILSTTGHTLIKMLSAHVLVESLLNKAKIRVVIPNECSDFHYDVATLERPENIEERFKELKEEYESAIGLLVEAYKKAKDQSDDIGTIDIYCAYTMLRQTITLIKGEDSIYGTMSITIPPFKTINGTPTFKFEGKIGEDKLASLVEKHCNAVINASIQRGDHFSVNEKTKKAPFFLERATGLKYWQDKSAIAKENMARQNIYSPATLIEIAAQHPLKKDGTPGREFEARLKYGLNLYNELKAKGEVVKIYIPGSLHMYNGVVDKTSLSSSGKTYLLMHNVSEEDVYADEMNAKYKGEDGVYNTADECYVASKIFFDEEYTKLISVCSPNQIARKTLYYIEFGVIPNCYSVPVDNAFHDVVEEVFETIDNVLYRDHNGQDRNSDVFVKSREERKPH